jgi:hypothetical protein
MCSSIHIADVFVILREKQLLGLCCTAVCLINMYLEKSENTVLEFIV